LMHLLGLHPRIVAYRPFEFDTRALGYWLEVARALSQPGSQRQLIAAEVTSDTWWLESTPPSDPFRSVEPGLHEWLAAISVDELLAFARARVRAFYRRVAATQGRQ